MGIKSLLIYLGQVGTYYPNISFFMTIFSFCWLGNFIMTQYLMEKQIKHSLSKLVFMITFSCSLSLLSMYLFEIMNFSIDQYYWYFVLVVLVAMCEIIIPLCLIFRLPFAGLNFSLFKMEIPAIGLLASGLYLFFFYNLVNTMWTSLKLQKFQIKILIEIAVYYGVYLMALMSAYGAIWFPYVCYNLINQKQKHKIAHAKKKMQDEIHFIIEQTKIHKYELLKIKNQIRKLEKEIVQSKESQGSGGITRIFNIFRSSGKIDQKQKNLKVMNEKSEIHTRELQTLKKVHEDGFLHYRDILEEERRHAVSQTLFGKFMQKWSFILAAYSVLRICLTLINIFRGRSRTLSADPITRILNFIQYLLGIDFGATFKEASQYISFIFMGYIMITSVRSFSMNFKTFIDYILRRRRLSVFDSATQIYLFSIIYGVYFLAAVILQQSGLPRAYVTTFEHITGKIDLIGHFILFDWLFMSMCIFSLCLMLFTELQRNGKLNVIIQQRNFIDTTLDHP